MDRDVLQEFLGWCTIINFGLMTLTSVMLICCRNWVTGIHERLTGVGQADLPRLYFQYLMIYKIAIIVFNVVPYLALRVMAH